MTDSEKREEIASIKRDEEAEYERQRELENERIHKLQESVDRRFQNDIKKYGDYEMIDTYDFIALKICNPYRNSKNLFGFYGGQFDYYIRSKDTYKNDKQFMELFKDYLNKQDKNSILISFDKEYKLLKEELYYIKIGKMGRSFTASEEREYFSLRNTLKYSDTKYNYNRIVSFLKNWDAKFSTREDDEKRKNDLIKKYN